MTVINRHTSKRIPSGAVSDAVLEPRRAGLAGDPAAHLGVVLGVDERQMAEHVVVRRDGRRVRVALEHCVQKICGRKSWC